MQEHLSFTEKHWEIIDDIYNVSVTDEVTQHLLRKRGFINENIPKGEFADMEKAVSRIKQAVETNEKIGIFGDYDCDGITSAALLARYFRRHKADFVVKLPHRVNDGYGLNADTVSWFEKSGIKLLITVDTGICSIDEITEARIKGIDVIITDHHQQKKEIPNAYAILHPALEKNYSEPHPSGAGVAYELVYALENGQWDGKDEDMALAMIGTVADLVPLKGNNRKLVDDGLKAFSNLADCPLATMRDKSKSKTSTDIAFRIAPRINAAGRMDDPKLALMGLLDGGEALKVLDELNGTRQEQMHELTEHALQSIKNPEQQTLLWAASSLYPHGIVGLIAGRLTENFGKPSCAVNINGDICTASLRSPPCYHITNGLKNCSDLLISYGGHAQAAGCTFFTRNAEAFSKKLAEDISVKVDPADLVPTLYIDAVINPQIISLSFIESLDKLQPFGQGNTEPLFLIRNVILDNLRCVGKEMSHLQFKVFGMKGIGFGLGHLKDKCVGPLDIVCRLGIDTWNGVKQTQIFAVDMRSV